MRRDAKAERAASRVNPFDERAPELMFDKDEQALAALDPGWAKAALYFRTGMHFGHPRGSMRARGLIAIHQEMEARRARFEQGSKVELLHAVLLCANENLPMPTWLALAFAATFGAYISVTDPTSSLDEAFGTARPGKKGTTAKRDWQLGFQLWATAFEAAVADGTLDTVDGVLAAVLAQKDWGVGKTKARELLLMIDRNQSELASTQGLSRFLKLRRKKVQP
jgi:hypothetical protein